MSVLDIKCLHSPGRLSPALPPWLSPRPSLPTPLSPALSPRPLSPALSPQPSHPDNRSEWLRAGRVSSRSGVLSGGCGPARQWSSYFGVQVEGPGCRWALSRDTQVCLWQCLPCYFLVILTGLGPKNYALPYIMFLHNRSVLICIWCTPSCSLVRYKLMKYICRCLLWETE